MSEDLEGAYLAFRAMEDTASILLETVRRVPPRRRNPVLPTVLEARVLSMQRAIEEALRECEESFDDLEFARIRKTHRLNRRED